MPAGDGIEYTRWSERKHSASDITILVHRAYERLGAMGLNFTAVDQREETTLFRLSEGSSFLAIEDNRIIGTITVVRPGLEDIHPWLARKDVAHFTQFAVDPTKQGLGIGLALLQLAEAEAVELGALHLALDTAIPATHLVQMYESWGYAPVGEFQWPGKQYRSVVLSKQMNAEN